MSEVSREILLEPLRCAAAWRGAEQAHRQDWVYRLSSAEVADLDRCVDAAAGCGRPLHELGLEDFAFDAMGGAIAEWMRELERGRGFVLARGVPVDRYTAEQARIAYWGIGLHMGTAVSQNAAGDLLGEVRDTGADPSDPSVRLYKTRESLGFHCDGADVIGLLCLRTARSGGQSRIASSVSVYNELLQRRPDLVPELYENFHWDRNEEQAPGEAPYFDLPICHFDGERLRTFYIGWYIRGAQRHAEAPRLTTAQNEVIDLIDEICEEPEFHLAMDFEPGDIQWLKNSVILHARTAYEDEVEPERRRHLLRLWLTAHGLWADGDEFLRQGIPRKDGVESDADAIDRSIRGRSTTGETE